MSESTPRKGNAAAPAASGALQATRLPSLRCWVSRARRVRRDEQPQPGQRAARVPRRGGGWRRSRRGSHARCARPRGAVAFSRSTQRRAAAAAQLRPAHADRAQRRFALGSLRTLTRLRAPCVAVLGSFAAYMRLVRGAGRSAHAVARVACSFRRCGASQVANEPSVGLYFVQEHVRKSIPFVIATKVHARAWKFSHTRAAPNTVTSRLLARRAQGRIRDTAKTAHMCKCVHLLPRHDAPSRRRTEALTRASVSSRRLDVDAGLETMKLVRDVGSPSLHRRAPRCDAPQRRAEAALPL